MTRITSYLLLHSTKTAPDKASSIHIRTVTLLRQHHEKLRQYSVYCDQTE